MSEPKSPPLMSVLKLAGPGLVVAATGIGSGDVVSATVGGARYGVVLLWAIALGAFFKFVLSEGIARWQLATGKTVLEGWAEYLPAWVKFYFAIYLVLWTVSVSAALTNATGLGLANLTGGAVPQHWGAVLHTFVGFAFVWFGGYGKFEKLMKALVGVMGFSILVCAALTMTNPGPALQGLVVPTIPMGSGSYVLSLIGGIGGSITMLSYNYWMREEKMQGAKYPVVRARRRRRGLCLHGDLRAVDHADRQSRLLSGRRDHHRRAGRAQDGGDAGFHPRPARRICLRGRVLGGGVRVPPRRLAERAISVWGPVRHPEAPVSRSARGRHEGDEHAVPDCAGFITLVPIPFAFTGRPLFIIVAYTVVGSLFVPFLAATLLYLNNRVAWTEPVPRNHWTTNLLLIAILALFVAVGAQEAIGALR